MKIIKNSVITTLILLLLIATTAFAAPKISDFAGMNEPGYADGAVLESKLNQPWGLTTDRDGHLIVVDSANHRLRTIVDSKMTTVAGVTEELDDFGLPLGGYYDDDPLKSMFDHPRYAVVDDKGDIYISDSQNHAIRKIENGKVYTLAGTGEAGYTNGDRTKAQFNSPSGLALDKAGNLYVADTLNHVIRKIGTDGNVSTYAGKYVEGDGAYYNGAATNARFNEPNDLVFDEKGNLYVSDSGNHVIRMIANSSVSTYAGKPTAVDEETGYMEGGYRNGAKEEALFLFPKGLAYAEGVLFIADTMNHRVRAVKADGTVINLVGSSTAGDTNGDVNKAQLFQPIDVVYAKGKLYVSDLFNNKVKVMAVDLANLEAVKNVDDVIAGIDILPAGEDIQVWFDYKPISFAKEKPLVANDRVYVPVRAVFEQWGAKVDWLEASREIEMSKGAWKVRFPLDAQQMIVTNGRTFIEVGQLAKITHLFIEWAEDYRAVLMDSIK